MKEIQFEGMVIVTSFNSEKFLGWLPSGMTPKQAEELVENEGTLTIHNARQLLIQLQPSLNPQTGQVVGMQSLMSLLPIDMLSGPMKVLKVRPSHFYYPAEIPESHKRVTALILQAEKNELASKASESGISLASSMPPAQVQKR